MFPVTPGSLFLRIPARLNKKIHQVFPDRWKYPFCDCTPLEFFVLAPDVSSQVFSLWRLRIMNARLVVQMFTVCILIGIMAPISFGEELSAEQIHAGFAQPPVECRPHTRWWWMGNALSKEDIAWQLDQMRAQGIGGVEQITMPPVYTQGNHEYLSSEYFDLLRYAVEQAEERGMEFSVNFGGPGWIWGGEWIPKEDQSKVLLASMLILEGPQRYSGPLSEAATPNPNDLPRSTPIIGKEDRLVKVVAGRLEGGRLRADSLVDLTASVQDRQVAWDVPAGQWQLMGFWITQRDNGNAVDHLNKGALTRYCETLGAQYEAAVGEHFGKTVDSFFQDSFEVPIFRNGLYWTDGLFEAFEEEPGYDLVRWLPALWWEVNGVSPKVRYDVNQFLHKQGMEAFFSTFVEWCKRHNVRARIQPYGFVTDVLEGAGKTDIPEMEITPGEKDAVPWFDTRIGPKAYVASGAHLYGRTIISTEAFTFLHHEPYRATLQELKIATDGFLHAGANKFYNHGFIASPEHDIVPTRGFFEAIRISPENIWWPYYHNLAEYTARCCWLLRQGNYVADVAVYSPLANQWTLSVLNARKWTREFDWGGLNQLLTSNGYAFDLVNDDILQNHSTFSGKELNAGAMTYRVLILPNIRVLPLETFLKVEAFVRQGGAVIALERTPEVSTGMKDHETQDAEVKRLSAELFGTLSGPDDNALRTYDKGRTYFMDTVLYRNDPLDYRSARFDPFIKTLRECVSPDMDIDLVRADKRTNEGLCCLHRRAKSMDIYFLTNIQDCAINEDVGLRTTQGTPYCWDPFTGERRAIHNYSRDDTYTRFTLSMAPYESRFIVFESSSGTNDTSHVERSDFTEIVEADAEGFTAFAAHNGPHAYQFSSGGEVRNGFEVMEGLPSVYAVNGTWKVHFEGVDAPKEEFEWPALISWTDTEAIRHFSGRGHYSLTFDLPQEYCSKDILLRLSLGAVGSVAEVRMNGKPVGVHWRMGQEFTLDGIAHVGKNELEADVTNTLINRVSGLKAFPDVAKELQPIYGTGLHPPHPRALRLLGFEPLPPSGLLGPVQIVPYKEVRIQQKKNLN